MAEIGHNSAIAKDQLVSIIERVENREEAKREIAEEIREIYLEAKSGGFDIRALRAIVKMRKIDADARREQEAVLERYMHALDMID